MGGMFGVYTPAGALIGHYPTAGEASRVALSHGDGARVTSEAGGYVVRDGTLRAATRRCAPSSGWQPVPADYVAGWLASAYGGCLN